MANLIKIGLLESAQDFFGFQDGELRDELLSGAGDETQVDFEVKCFNHFFR